VDRENPREGITLWGSRLQEVPQKLIVPKVEHVDWAAAEAGKPSIGKKTAIANVQKPDRVFTNSFLYGYINGSLYAFSVHTASSGTIVN
jgi:hypothetical protein